MKVECKKLNFSYSAQSLIKNLDFSVESGNHIWLRGPSGTGKSSLLRLIAGILKPQSGSIQIGSEELTTLPADQVHRFRLNNVGYLHQDSHLVEHWTVLQNFQLVSALVEEAISLLTIFQLDETYLNPLASYLSGGEKQRVSFVRLLLQKPKLVLLDEPTAHLDDKNTEILLYQIKERLKTATLIIVSHDNRLARFKIPVIEFSEINQ